LLQVTLGIGIFGKDQDPSVIPLGPGLFRIWAKVITNPSFQATMRLSGCRLAC
jgi:hypothetical protein